MNRIIICGKGGCGKTYLKEKFVLRGYTPSISYTSRDIRKGEIDGHDYHFVSKNKFENLIETKSLLEWEEFNGDYYGTPIDTTGNVLIMSTDGIKQIPTELRNQFFVIYLDVPRENIVQRLKNRGWTDERVDKRLVSVDDVKFKDFTDFDLRIANPDF